MEIFGSLQSLGIEWGTGVMFILLLLLLLTGMPLAYVTLMVALIFALGWFGPTVVPLITSNIFSFVSSFVFVSVPMFVLMAAVLDRSGIARDLFDAMKIVGGKLRGRGGNPDCICRCHPGRNVRDHWRRSGSLGTGCAASDAAIGI